MVDDGVGCRRRFASMHDGLPDGAGAFRLRNNLSRFSRLETDAVVILYGNERLGEVFFVGSHFHYGLKMCIITTAYLQVNQRKKQMKESHWTTNGSCLVTP